MRYGVRTINAAAPSPRSPRIPEPADKPGNKLRRKVRPLTVVLVLLALVTLGGFVLYRQWTATPAHVAQVQRWIAQTTEQERDQLARQVEMRLPKAYTDRIDPGTDGVRTLEASFEEINAWLDQRLEALLQNRGIAMPRGVGAVMVHERDGRIVIAADVDLPQLRQIVSVYLKLHPPEDLPPPEDPPEDTSDAGSDAAQAGASGDAPPWSVTVDKATAGNVPLPVGRLIGLVREQLPAETLAKPMVAEMLDAVEAGRPIPLPRLKVDGSREAEVWALRVSPAGVEADLRVFRTDGTATPTPPRSPVTGPVP